MARPSRKDKEQAEQAADFQDWLRGFERDFGPFIDQVASLQQRALFDPEIQELSAASTAVNRIGSDGRLDPRALDLATRIRANPHVAELERSAGKLGVKGIGVLTANVEAAIFVGGQVGAELVCVFPYKVGDYTTPARLIGRAWYEASLGVDLGISGTIMIFPFNFSFWFLPPENTKHMAGIFWNRIVGPGGAGPGAGPRVEIFGWAPEDSAADFDLPGLPVDYIHGFRVVAEIGWHRGGGTVWKGHQVTSNKDFQLAGFQMNPTNLEEGRNYDLSDSAHTLMGTVTPPQRDEAPVKSFQNETSTLQLTFPSWMFSAQTKIPAFVFKDDGTGTNNKWSPANTPTPADPTFQFKWVGKSGEAWKNAISFPVPAYSKTDPASISPTDKLATCTLNGLNDEGPRSIDISLAGVPMDLSTQVFHGSGTVMLTADQRYNTIENWSGYEFDAKLNADNANPPASPKSFYYIMNGSQPLMTDCGGLRWYAGYLFEQQQDAEQAHYCAVFWQYGEPYGGRYVFQGPWQPLTEDNDEPATVTWDNGGSNNTTTLKISLKPSAA